MSERCSECWGKLEPGSWVQLTVDGRQLCALCVALLAAGNPEPDQGQDNRAR